MLNSGLKEGTSTDMFVECVHVFSSRPWIMKIINRITTNGAFIDYRFEETAAIPML